MRRRLLAIGASAYALAAIVALWATRPRIQYCADGMDTETGQPWGYCGDATVSEGAILGTVATVLLLAAFLVVLQRVAPRLRTRVLVPLGVLLVAAPIAGALVAAAIDPFAGGLPAP